MSYENPRQIDYAARSRAIAEGLQKMFTDVTGSIAQHQAAKKKEQEEANNIIAKKGDRAKGAYEKAYVDAKTKADKFTRGLGDTQDKESDALLFRNQINVVLVDIGDQLDAEIKRIQKEGGGMDEIATAKAEAITKMNSFSQDMVNWDLARQEYLAAKEKGPGEVGALMNNQKNSNLIKMFEAATDDAKGNLFISEGPDGHFMVSLGEFGDDGSFNAEADLDMTLWTQDQKGKGSYFEQVEEFGRTEYDQMAGLMKEIAKKPKKGEEGRFRIGTKDDPTAEGNEYMDKEALKDYFLNDDVGKATIRHYLDDSKRGDWRRMAPAGSSKWSNAQWEAYDSQYKDDLFLEKLIDRSIDRLDIARDE